MASNLTVITHTRGDLPDLLERCVDSVRRSLPSDARHEIIQCNENWPEARLKAALSSEFVCFIDDDNVVGDDFFKIGAEAIRRGADFVIVDEQVVFNGEPKRFWYRKPTYEDFIQTIRISHGAIFRSRLVDPRALDMHHSLGFGIDWLIGASVGLRGKTVWAPNAKYFSTFRPGSMTRVDMPKIWAGLSDLFFKINETWGPPPSREIETIT